MPDTRRPERRADPLVNAFRYYRTAIITALVVSMGCSTPHYTLDRDSVGMAAASGAMPVTKEGDSSSVASGAAADSKLPESTGVEYFGTPDELQRLNVLWASRTQTKPFTDFPIGPGDEISISVPGVDELTDTVRVSATGTINLAFIGQIQAAGLTEEELRHEIENRLRKYMHEPEFKMFVKEYQTRFVAVLGAVRNPGVFALSGPSETILQLLSQAGGALQDGAADRVILIPALPSTSAPDPQVMTVAARITDAESIAGRPAAAAQVHNEEGVLRPFLGSNGSPLVISMRNNPQSDSARYLNMPLRPGDVVVVPSGGDVAVVGWVYNPGHFKITSGLTALSAIGAAGGLLYAADQHDVQLLRAGKDGTTESIPLDVDKIKAGQAPNPLVQGNDVIEAPYSKVKILPYTLYQIMNTKVGVALPTY